MSPALCTTLPFERLAVTMVGRPYDLFGEATILGDRRSWRVDRIAIHLDGAAPLHLKPGTEVFETVRVALHRQCGDNVAERLNGFVEERGGYEILFGEALPADRFRRGLDRCGEPDRLWLDAA